MSLLAFSSLLLGGCTLNNPGKEKHEGIDVANMDTTFKPGENFYMYAIGNWKKKNPIPAEYSTYGSFNQLDENNTKMLKDMFDELSKRKDLNDEQKKIMYFYNSGMDTNAIEKTGIEPLKQYVNEINSLSNPSSIAGLIGKFHHSSLFSTFYLYSAQDEKNSNMVIAQLFQGGLGLPDRDYYLSEDEVSKMLRSEYQKYITNILKLSNLFPEKDLENITKNIMSFETRLAKASMSRVDMRDPQKLYHKMTVVELQKLSPDFNWKDYFTALGKSDLTSLNIGQPDFFKEINKMLKEVHLEQWKQYLTFHLINDAAPYLGKDYEKTNFAFYGTVLSGKTKMKDRWKKVVEMTSDMLGEAVGKLYVQKYFPEDSKTRMLELVKNLKATFREHIQKSDWMTHETKQKAVEKLDAMNLKIGYPDKWRDYSAVAVKEQPFILNVLAAQQFETDYMLSQIDKPVDRQKWDMNPQTVNAYYNPNMNEIVFPAAILQPPFFNAKADDAVNYGGIGAVIGHEMTHGFDDQGRQYDKNGNLNDWWNATDAANFKNKTDKLIPAYESYLINDSLHVNGKLTMGENIADMGGLSLSVDAFKKTLKGDEQPIDGFTPIQRFYLSFANVWRQNIRPQELQRRLKEDVHSPAEVRVNVPLYDFNDFYTAFNIKPTDKRYIKPDERLKIW
jgi:putative endopeptidase